MNLDDLQELIQDDLLCFFDGMSNDTLDKMCELIVNRFTEFKTCFSVIVKNNTTNQDSLRGE